MIARYCIIVALLVLRPANAAGQAEAAPATLLRAGLLIDPVTGRATANQAILISGGTIQAVGTAVAVPTGAKLIDLSDFTVLPGLFETHTHLTAGYDPRVTNLLAYPLVVSTAERALQGVATAWQLMAAGFTTVRDLGNAGNFADAALARFFGSGDRERRTIYGGAAIDHMQLFGHRIVGPTIVYAGKIIAPFGAQFRVSPEYPDIGRQDYFYADTRDELRAAIRRNIHYGATWIKIVVDDQHYKYNVADLRFVVAEAAAAGAKVAAHCVTDSAARHAIEAGVASIEHGYGMSDETLLLAKQHGIVLVGTDPAGVWMRQSGRSAADERTIDRLRRAYEIGVPMAFGADVVRAPPDWYDRGEITMSVVDSWVAAGIPPVEILRAMTTNAAKLLGMETERGAIAPGFAADIIATAGDPLKNVEALKHVVFVMKSGSVFKAAGDPVARRQ